MISLPYRWIAAALVVLAALGGSFYEGDKHGTGVVQAAWDKERAAVVEAGAKAQTTVDATHATQETTIAAADTGHTENLNHEITDVDSHRAPVAAGIERVRIVSGVCPARSDNVPEAAAGAGQVDGAPVELSRAGAQDVLDLEAALAGDRAKILFLQEYAAALQR